MWTDIFAKKRYILAENSPVFPDVWHLLGHGGPRRHPAPRSRSEEILKLETIVRADRSFALEELLAEESQIRIQRPNLTMDVRQVAVPWTREVWYYHGIHGAVVAAVLIEQLLCRWDLLFMMR